MTDHTPPLDLVQRLREKSRLGYWPLIGDEAADEIERLRAALQEADTIMGHDDEATEWRDKWAHLWGPA